MCRAAMKRRHPDAAVPSIHSLRVRVVFGCCHLNFDQQSGACETGLDAGAHRHVLAAGPLEPDFVHGIAITDVGDPDHRRDDLRLICAGEGEEAVDFGQGLLGLALDVEG